MNKETIIKKLTSRKFIVSLLTVIAGIAMLFGAEGEITETVLAVCVTVIPGVVYCITEGRLDSKALENFKNAIDVIDKTLEKNEKKED